jgi:tetratricopeptide (TPR) repeat protein
MLQEAQRHLRDAEKRIGDALQGPVSGTSLADELKRRYQQIAAQSAEVQSLATFYQEADTAWFQIGAEHDEEARAASEAAVKAIGALDNAEWWKQLPVQALHLQKSQVAQLQQDVYQQLILLAAMRAKPAALNMTASPDAPIRAAREALQQADRFQPSAGAAVVDWFCRMRLGERDLPPLPEPKTGTDYFLLGIAHFWIAQFADTPLGGMVLAGAPRQSGIDLDAPAESAIRLLRTASNLNPQQYWHNFTLAWALSTMGERAAGMSAAPLASSAAPQSVAVESKSGGGGLSDSISSFLSPKKQTAPQADPSQQYFRDAELALNTCVALRPRFPVGYELRGRVMILEALGLRRLAARTEAADERANLLRWADKFQVQGLNDFDQAVRLDPNNPDTHWARGHCYELLAMIPEALADYGFALESDQPMKRITGQTWLGIADKFLTDLSHSDQQHDKASVLGLLALLSLVRHQGGDAQQSTQLLQQALDTANKALQLQSEEPRALTVRGTARLERGDFDKALQDFDDALKQKDRRNYLALIGRAQVLEQLKQYEAARAAFAVVAGDAALPAWQRDEGRSGEKRCQDKLATNKISSS